MDILPEEVHRHISSFLSTGIDAIAYECTCRSAYQAINTSFRKILYDHVRSVVRDDHYTERTMSFLARTGAFIGGVAAVKSIMHHSQMPDCPLLNAHTDIDMYCPVTDKLDHIRDIIIKVYGRVPDKVFCDTEYFAMFTFTLMGIKIKIKLIPTDLHTHVHDAIRSIVIRGFQFALGFHAISERPIVDNMDFVRRCDVSLDHLATNDILSSRLVISYVHNSPKPVLSWIENLLRVVKYMKDCSWTLSHSELQRMESHFESLITRCDNMARIYFKAIWDSIIMENASLFNTVSDAE